MPPVTQGQPRREGEGALLCLESLQHLGRHCGVGSPHPSRAWNLDAVEDSAAGASGHALPVAVGLGQLAVAGSSGGLRYGPRGSERAPSLG